MKICIIGSGNVGGALGRVWARAGHSIIFGTREPGGLKLAELLAAIGPAASAAPIAEAAAEAAVVVLATPFNAVKDAIESAGSLDRKILVDCTNPIAPGFGRLLVGTSTSGAEEIARMAEGARVVKAFNTTGAENMLDPNYGDLKADMFVCADDDKAKAVVIGLAQDAGFDVVDSGPLSNARLLEPMALLWVYLAMVKGMGRDFAFKLLRR